MSSSYAYQYVPDEGTPFIIKQRVFEPIPNPVRQRKRISSILACLLMLSLIALAIVAIFRSRKSDTALASTLTPTLSPTSLLEITVSPTLTPTASPSLSSEFTIESVFSKFKGEVFVSTEESSNGTMYGIAAAHNSSAILFLVDKKWKAASFDLSTENQIFAVCAGGASPSEPLGGVIAASEYGILYSADGSNWAQSSDITDWSDETTAHVSLAWDSSTSNYYLFTGSNLYLGSEGGSTWAKILSESGPANSIGYATVQVDSSTSLIVLAYYYSDTLGVVRYSSNEGRSFSEIYNSGNSYPIGLYHTEFNWFFLVDAGDDDPEMYYFRYSGGSVPVAAVVEDVANVCDEGWAYSSYGLSCYSDGMLYFSEDSYPEGVEDYSVLDLSQENVTLTSLANLDSSGTCYFGGYEVTDVDENVYSLYKITTVQ